MALCSTSKAQIPSGYYSSADGLTGGNLKSALNDVIDGHTEYSYSDLWDILKVTDVDPNNSSNVIGIYSRFSMNAAAEYDGGAGWNREHVWAKSRGDFGTSNGAGTDLHHIRASDVSTNSARNNRVFDEGGSIYVDASGNYSGTTPATQGSDWTWEPGDDQKGDVARMIFYMATRYEGENGEVDLELNDEIMSNTDDSPYHGRLSVLLDWHEEDPVSIEETNRHEAIYSYQNNRNPFIDHPEYVDAIWGSGTGGGSTTLTCSTTINSFPYEEGFENGFSDWSQGSDDDFDWVNQSGSTGSSNTGPSSASEGTYYIYVESSSPNYSSKTTIIESPCFDLNGQSSPTLNFQYHMYGAADMGGLVLEVSTNGSGWDELWSELGDQGDAWSTASVSLSSYIGSIVKFRFTGTTGVTWQGDMAIDAISLATGGSTGGGGGGSGTSLFISEYIEGSSNNKAIEIGNLTGTSVDLSSYSLKKQVNGAGSWSNTLTLSGALADGDVYAIAYSSASTDLTSMADLISGSSALTFNGNDPVGLFKDDVLVDIVGDFDGGSGNFAQNTTLVRNSNAANTTYTTSEWDISASDTFTYFGSLSGSNSGGGDSSSGGTDMPTGYCASEGSNSSYEWLDYVQVGTLINSSGENGGYEDYTSQTVTLTTDASVNYEFRPGFSSSTYQETYRLWIDFNRDGDFEDANELVVDEALTSATVSGSFTIPSSVSAGYTRMRVSMKYDGTASTCETFSYGEVEDYQVLLSGSGASRITNTNLESKSDDIKVYPNPAYNHIVIDYADMENSFDVVLYNSEGKQALRASHDQLQNLNSLDVSHLDRGLYLMVVGNEFKRKLVLK